MIRNLRLSDVPRLKELQASCGIEWELPDFTSQEILSARVLVDDADRVVMFGGARKLAEVFAILDPTWESPGLREAAFTSLYGAVEHDLEVAGVNEVTAWMPPKVFKSFFRRLKRRFGWTQSRWINVTGFVGIRK